MTVPADFADEVLDIEVWVASRDATASEQSNPSTGSLLPTEVGSPLSDCARAVRSRELTH